MRILGGLAVSMVLAFAVSAFAGGGDRLLGVILTTDGGTVSNASTGYGSAGCNTQASKEGAGGCFQAFNVPVNALLSVQCRDQAAMFRSNWYTVDAGVGVKLAADQFFTTATKVGPVTVPLVPDGGRYTGGVVSIAPVAGGTRAECAIFDRSGEE